MNAVLVELELLELFDVLLELLLLDEELLDEDDDDGIASW